MTEIYILELILAGQSTQAELRQIQGDPTDLPAGLVFSKSRRPWGSQGWRNPGPHQLRPQEDPGLTL